MRTMDVLTPPVRVALNRLLRRIEDSDGVRPVNESADLVVAGHRPGGVLVVDGQEGEGLVGFAVLDDRDQTIQVGVDPAHRRRGHGSALLRAALRARPGHAVWAFGTLEGAVGLAAHLGLEPVRQLLQMGRPLGIEPAPLVPDGWRLRAYCPDDAAGVVATNRAAFVHHPEQGRLTLEEFTELTAQPWFTADGLIVATPSDDDGRIVGFHWTKRRDGETGEVYVLAVHPDVAGRGLGRVLLQAGLSHLAAAGCVRVVLFVEASEERVVAMYRSASFETSNTDTSYRS